ncbi:MAG: hypothetical protein JWM98_2185 [Thermoleophilia bacterium]|nr:hypothetical protein [Thermoleophilia bacterium]
MVGRWKIPACLVALLAIVAATLPAVGRSATSGTVVAATVPSATNLSLTGCGPAARSFGVVLPGTSATTAAPCTVTFGSSNDVARLRMYQPDGAGVGMFRYADATPAAGFGTGGANIGAAGPGTDSVTAFEVAPDGSSYVGGWSDFAGTWRMCVRHILANGTPDPAFGTSGVLTTRLVAPPQRYDLGLTLQPDGKLLVAGPITGAGGFDFGVERYSAAGVADPTFGTAGLAQVPVGTGQDWAHDVLVRPNGTLVVTGEANNFAGVWDLAAVGLLANGQVDTTFGTNGITTANSGGTAWDFAYTADLMPDGRIVLGGQNNGPGASATYTMHLLVLRADGAVDTSFGAAGWLQFASIGTAEGIGDVRGLADGDIGFAAYTFNGTTYKGMIGRTSPTGVPRASFGTGGLWTWDGGARNTGISGIDELADGRIVGAGYAFDDTANRFALARIEADGTPDASMGPGGVAYAGVGTGNSGFNEVREGADGSLYAGGYAIAANQDQLVMRFAGIPVPDHAAGVSDWNDGAGMFGACLDSVGSSAATAPWIAVGTAACGPADSAGWRPVASTALAAGAQVATATANTTTSSATFRFGFRVPTAQSPGRYAAPLTIDVLAP